MHSERENPADGLLLEAFHEVMRNSEDYIFIKDRDLVYRGCSESFAQMAGLRSAGDLIGKTDCDLFPPEISDKYRADDRTVLENGTPIEGMAERLPDRDGQRRWTKTWKHAVYAPDGTVAGIYGVSRDVTRIVKLEAEAERSKKYSDLVCNLPGGVGILHEQDGEFWLDFANDGWSQAHHITEVHGRQLVGKTTTALIYEPDRARLHAEFQRVDSIPGSQGSMLYRIHGDDGRLHWLSVRFRFAYEQDGVRCYYVSYADMDEQKAAEEQLQDSQRALREAVENSEIQFFTYFPQAHRCELYAVNQMLKNLPAVWKDFPDDFLTYTGTMPEDARAYRELFHKIDAGAEQAECTVRFRYKGVIAWERIVVRAVKDESGRVVKGLGYALNVSSRKQAAERLERQRLRLRTLGGSAVETFSFNVTKNSDANLQTVDEELMDQPIPDEIYREVMRLSPPLNGEESESLRFLMRAAARIPEPGHRALFLRTCGAETAGKALQEGHYSAEIRYRRQVGQRVRWVATRAEYLPDPETGDLLAFYYTWDVTDEEISRRMNRRIVERNYAAVLCCDLQTRQVSVKNSGAAAAPLDGLTYEEAIRAVASAVEPAQAAEFMDYLSLENILPELEKRPVDTTYCTLQETRTDLPGAPRVQLKSDAFYLDDYRDVLVFLLTDVTEIFQQDRENREQMAAALAAAKQASLAKSNFLSRMSHEIRTPLNAIIGMDTIAAQSVNDPARIADCISKIGISARYLLSIINDILDMSRIESGKMLLKNEKFLFRDFINGINTMIYTQTRAKGLDYECTVHSEIAEAYIGDAMKLQQILINILGNALKFTEKGKISLEIHPISRREKQSVVRFVVNDTGIGIREDFLDKLFEPFEQSDTSTTATFGGTGLGLAITKNLVTLMGGTIHVRSIVGVGSEFTVDVPLTIDESVLVEPKLSMHFEKMQTLIVDDDLVVCEQAGQILQSIGMSGEWVTTGAEAVERVQANSAKSRFYDFILVDWKMPDMDGLETTRQIRRIVGPDVTIIIITAYDWESIEIEAKAAGANLLISKPLLRSTLVSAFQKARGIAETERPREPSFDFTGRRVLVAEDNQINAEIAKTLLENKHFTVEVAANGQKALELYAGHPEHYYDAILMDIRMPLMDGLQTTTNIRHWNRADAKTIPIIAMTANAFDEDVDKSKAAGMNAHLSKPIDPNLLYSTLYRILDEEEL